MTTPPATPPAVPNVTVTVSQNPRGMFVVTTLSGHPLELQSAEEKSFYTDAQAKYMSENIFSAASDMRALDRLIFYETQMHRWSWQLSLGMDYDYELLQDADEAKLRRNVKETAPLISQMQIDLGLTKAAREKDKHDSVGGYITQLQIAAKEHGIRREKQLGKGIELCKELFSVVGAYKRSNANERKKLGFESAEDIVDYILEVFKPQFDEVDAHFRATNQRFWIRKI